jgi:hypothetical protein
LAKAVPFWQTCDSLGAATIFYRCCLDFGREVWSLQQKGISDESLVQECATLIAKWVSRGLSLSVLEAVRSDVCNVSAPFGS